MPLPKIRIRFTHDKMDPRYHSTFKILLRDGNSYVMDLAGAQYSLRKTVMPWEQYSGTLNPEDGHEFPHDPFWDDDQPQDADYLGKSCRGLMTATNQHVGQIMALLERNAWCCAYAAQKAWVSQTGENKASSCYAAGFQRLGVGRDQLR